LRLKKYGFDVKKILIMTNIVSYILGIAAIVLMYSTFYITFIIFSLTLTGAFICAFFLGKVDVERITSKANKEFQIVD
ncbi:hypothetical protein KKB18_10180, partial [bacterium]|nr:hypothetical protein [bacterium]